MEQLENWKYETKRALVHQTLRVIIKGCQTRAGAGVHAHRTPTLVTIVGRDARRPVRNGYDTYIEKKRGKKTIINCKNAIST